MTWRLRIRHSTGFRYDGPVVASYNEARMTPLTSPTQTTLHAVVDVSPAATTYRYWDYWGAQVHAFDVHEPHEALQVVATSIVETGPPAVGRSGAGWEVLRDETVRDRLVEWLAATPRTAPDEELTATAHELAAERGPGAAAHAIAAWVHETLDYVPGATGVHTRAVDAWRERKGVCQDLAHITVGMLREVGIPARYVSGYLHPKARAGVGEAIRGESHAWVEWWEGGWVPWDPTNDVPAGEQHVIVARGRDYGDVPPLKGLYSGPASSTIGVSVEVQRLA